MGSNFSRDDRWPRVRVSLTGFHLSEYLVTQDLFQQVMGFNRSHFKGPRFPVTNVNYDEAGAFCHRLMEMMPGRVFRLPTEAEWERAAISGAGYRYAGSDLVDEVGWYHGNSGIKLQPVGLKKPNGAGLYDMSGNVWEWCSDWYRDKYARRPWPLVSTIHNPRGKLEAGNNRVVRGGCFLFHQEVCAVRARSRRPPAGQASYVGFRLLMEG